ncbi:MAG: MFS transporter [Lachnospiraceae bacterium]|jgi:UMF1 family MFS transporter|nr:MFS transporter [Lachnospiraceae bacterium]
MKLTREEKSWITYDWANSSYATIMVAAIFPIYFSTVSAGSGEAGDFWWGIATSIATVLMALCAPIVGALADYKGWKTKLFQIFLVIGVGFTLFAGIVTSWPLLIVGYVLSHIGWSGTLLLSDSFLTDITSRDRMDKVSALAYASGYLGGSTIPFLISILLITFGDKIGLTGTTPVRISVILTAVWWAVFTIPFLKHVKQKYGKVKPEKHLIAITFSSIFYTAKAISRDSATLIFLCAYFFYIDGVNTVIGMATAYGATLQLDSTGMIVALMVTQLVAIPFALLFGNLSRRVTALRLIMFAVVVYFFICILGFVMGFGLEEAYFGVDTALVIFWILAVLVGTVQGGIQAVSRSYFGKLVPPERSGEYFGFYDIFGKFAAVLGPLLYALIKSVTGRSSFSILSIIVLFGIGFLFLFAGRKKLLAAEK